MERNLETVFLEHLEKLTKTNFSEDTKQKLASRFNISYHQYGDLVVPIDLKRFKMFKKDLISNVDLKVNEKVSSYILYIPVISLQYVSLSSFQLWKKIEPGNNFLNINEVYRIEGVYSFPLALEPKVRSEDTRLGLPENRCVRSSKPVV